MSPTPSSTGSWGNSRKLNNVNLPRGLGPGVFLWARPGRALATIFAAGILLPVMPYLLAFAAGAMMYVVVEELIPEMAEGKHSNAGTVCFAAGFVLMMALDTALG